MQIRLTPGAPTKEIPLKATLSDGSLLFLDAITASNVVDSLIGCLQQHTSMYTVICVKFDDIDHPGT